MTVQDWKTFLSQHSARFDSSDPQCWAHFADILPPDNMLTMTPLTQYGLLEVAGKDAQKFLQGQLTCDVNQLLAGLWQSGAVCNPQGRVYGNFALGLTNDEIPCYLMRLPLDIIDSVKQQLGKYIVFYKSSMTFQPDYWAGFELRGEDAGQILAEAFSTNLDQLTEICSRELGILRPLDHLSGYECWLPFKQVELLWTTLANRAQLGDSHWRSLENIRRGLPDIQQATADHFTPEAINLTHSGAVSFKKGCYTGQEIVARMHYRGTAKTGLIHLVLDSDSCLLPGTELECKSDEQKITLINSVLNEQGRIEALAVASTRLHSLKTLDLLVGGQAVKAEISAFNTPENQG